MGLAMLLPGTLHDHPGKRGRPSGGPLPAHRLARKDRHPAWLPGSRAALRPGSLRRGRPGRCSLEAVRAARVDLPPVVQVVPAQKPRNVWEQAGSRPESRWGCICISAGVVVKYSYSLPLVPLVDRVVLRGATRPPGGVFTNHSPSFQPDHRRHGRPGSISGKGPLPGRPLVVHLLDLDLPTFVEEGRAVHDPPARTRRPPGGRRQKCRRPWGMRRADLAYPGASLLKVLEPQRHRYFRILCGLMSLW
jgi:hypothetical protein